jgi:hypothetical protein
MGSDTELCGGTCSNRTSPKYVVGPMQSLSQQIGY